MMKDKFYYRATRYAIKRPINERLSLEYLAYNEEARKQYVIEFYRWTK